MFCDQDYMDLRQFYEEYRQKKSSDKAGTSDEPDPIPTCNLSSKLTKKGGALIFYTILILKTELY